MAEAKFAEELKKMEREPLLPVEKKLVVWSVVLGLCLIGVLALLKNVLFPT
jgi:hypothetical protein